ncbi:5-hydroxytryptamine receptor 2A-like isoform X2 [Panonychus citri]|uniref:5-hydroxytryptamine receptor 2A-like isoform X2 n=1 Tax=Panonychus citri TaxID=50023 RepID=UPI00230711A3|nr:5-hydroxytryptamine receptor 2A-like isoform X2 [Panonychus citri]
MDQIVGSSSTFNLTDDVMTNLTLCLTFAIDDDESNETLTLMENNEVFTNDLTICLERRLQNATNFFLLSLAIADLLVSILVMPMSIVNEVYGYWPFGRLTCNFWVTCDVLCCSSSIYHMCFISVGRYVGIKNPLHARQARLLVSRRAVLLKIVIVWLIAALITSPITILGVIDSSNIMPDPLVCSIDNKYFLIIGAFSAFYLPMMIMVNSYVLTVRLLRRKAKFCKNSTDPGKWPPSSRTSITEKSHGNQGDNGKYSDNQRCFKRDFDTRKIKTTFSFKTRSLHSISDDNDNNNFRRSSNQIGNKRPSPSGSILGGQFGTDIRCRISKYYNTQPMMIRTLGSSVQVRTEQKATQVLGLVFFLFIICWSPFFTRNLIEALFTNIQMPASLPTIFLWLGYFSSTINPVIYTIFNRNFRRAFRRIILCQTIKYRLQRSSQSFTPNQRIGGRRGIYNNSNQNSPNVNNNNNNNDNDNDDNDNDNVNDNPDSGMLIMLTWIILI